MATFEETFRAALVSFGVAPSTQSQEKGLVEEVWGSAAAKQVVRELFGLLKCSADV
jgi:hypothetical protein